MRTSSLVLLLAIGAAACTHPAPRATPVPETPAGRADEARHTAPGPVPEAAASRPDATPAGTPPKGRRVQDAPVKVRPLVARALDGPYPSLQAWCRAIRKSRSPTSLLTACVSTLNKPVPLEHPPAPWLAAEEIQSEYGDTTRLRVALGTKAGWFVSRPEDKDSQLISHGSLELRDLVPGGAPEILVHYQGRRYEVDRPNQLRWYARCTERLAFCGLGAHGRPSCTRAIPVREGGCYNRDEPAEWDWELRVRYLPGSRVSVQRRKGKLPSYPKLSVGTFSLDFHARPAAKVSQ